MESSKAQFFDFTFCNLALVGWLGLVCRRPSEQKVFNLYCMTWVFDQLLCEVPMPSEMGAKATDLKSSSVIVEQPLDGVLPAPGVRYEAESSLWYIFISMI